MAYIEIGPSHTIYRTVVIHVWVMGCRLHTVYKIVCGDCSFINYFYIWFMCYNSSVTHDFGILNRVCLSKITYTFFLSSCALNCYHTRLYICTKSSMLVILPHMFTEKTACDQSLVNWKLGCTYCTHNSRIFHQKHSTYLSQIIH